MRKNIQILLITAFFFLLLSLSDAKASFYGPCPGSDNQCWVSGNSQQEACPVLPSITINSPVDGATYNTKVVSYNIAIQEQVQQIKVKLNGATSYNEVLCTSCSSFSGNSRELNDGSYQMCVEILTQPKGPCSGNSYFPFVKSACTHFEIQNVRIPQILSVIPADHAIIAGSNTEQFSIRYNESSLKNISFIYGKIGNPSYYSYTKTTCPSGTNSQCNFTMDFSLFDNHDTISFYFKVVNTLTGVAFSTERTATVLRTSSSFEILTPANNSYFNSTNVPINIWTNGTAPLLKSSIDDGALTQLCTSCNGYQGVIIAPEGNHILNVQLTNSQSNTTLKQVNFAVDSILPSFVSQSPLNNSGVLGEPTDFTINYTESQLKNITLVFIFDKGKTNESTQKIPLTGCISGQFLKCIKNVNLTNYPAKMHYQFEISDNLHTVKSPIFNISVLPKPPVLTINSPKNQAYGSRYIAVNASTNGIMNSITYSADSSPFTVLCTNCANYSGTKSFTTDGSHTITIIAYNAAGANDTKTASFFVDSVAPYIISWLPANGAQINSPNFSIKYTESNLDKILIYWKGPGEEYQSAIVDGCVSGSNKECALSNSYAPYVSWYPSGSQVSYFFRIFDIVRDINTTSRTLTIKH